METPTSEKTAQSQKTIFNKLKKTDSGGIVYTYTATVEIPLGLKVQAKFQDDMIVDDFLQQVCHRSGLDPDDHYLTFNNREVDLDISCKGAGMHPNCTLKLFRGRRAAIKIDIKVVIQVKDVRFSSVFRSIDSLWFILKCLCAHDTFDEELVPIIIFMKQEFIGKEAMKMVTLRDLGITKGSCFLRFLQLKQEDLDQRKLKDDNVSQGTLESLELIAAGPTTDAGVRNVHFSPFIDEKPPTVMYIGGRCAVLFEQPTEFDARTELHDEFFDTTVEEIQFMFKELQKTSETIMNMEEIKKIVRSALEKTKQRKAYQDETVIRVYFPDSYVIQALFAPEETIDDVKGYLRTFLDSEDDFQLFLTPQKTEALQGINRLGDLKLVPTGKLYFDQSGPIRSQYFQRRIMGNITSYENAAETALVVRGPSLIKFMNYSPIYGQGIADKILNIISNISDWFRRDESTSFTKRNKLVPNWLKTDSSQDSLNGTDKKMTSFMDTSIDDSWTDDRYGSRIESRGSIGRQALGGKRKSILVENRRKNSADYLEEKNSDKEKGREQTRKPSSSKYFQNLRRRTTKSDHNRFSQ